MAKYLKPHLHEASEGSSGCIVAFPSAKYTVQIVLYQKFAVNFHDIKGQHEIISALRLTNGNKLSNLNFGQYKLTV